MIYAPVYSGVIPVVTAGENKESANIITTENLIETIYTKNAYVKINPMVSYTIKPEDNATEGHVVTVDVNHSENITEGVMVGLITDPGSNFVVTSIIV